MLENIFAQPIYVENVGNVYPIKLKDYDKFIKCSNVLYISKKYYQENEYPLLFLLFMTVENLGFTHKQLINDLEALFSLVTHNEFYFIQDENYIRFEHVYRDENGIHKKYIDADNYEKIRFAIMKQNLMYEQKVYKTERMRKWAEKAMEAKQRKAPKITLEDMVSTVSVYCGKHYWDLENYTIYQIYFDFYRLRKKVEHNSGVHFLCAGAKDLELRDFAESLDLYHNPYDDLFVSADKLSGLNKAIGK